MLLLEHTGRRSGRARYVCLEVVEHPSPKAYVIVSGFGHQAQWYRNLEANPDCRVSTGRQRARPARARFLSASDSAAALARYQASHRIAWQQLRAAIEQATGRPAADLPMIELTLA